MLKRYGDITTDLRGIEVLNTEEGVLSPKPPFDFSKSLDFLGMFPPMREEQKIEEVSLSRAVSIGSQIIAFTVRSTGLIKNPRLRYTLFCERALYPASIDAVSDRIGFFLSIHDDLAAFYRIGYGDVDFAPIVQRLYGLHQVKFLTPFESACWAVLSQRYPMAAALRTKKTLVEKFGSGLHVDGRFYPAFPEPARLARVTEEQLFPIIRNRRRVQYLMNVAKAFSETNELFLRTAKYEQVEEWLRDIKGIGEWSSRLILVRGLGRMEKLAVENQLLGVASQIYGHGKPLARSTLDQIAERYGPWKGYWAYYLRTISQ